MDSMMLHIFRPVRVLVMHDRRCFDDKNFITLSSQGLRQLGPPPSTNTLIGREIKIDQQESLARFHFCDNGKIRNLQCLFVGRRLDYLLRYTLG